jgi:hypothetical protein
MKQTTIFPNLALAGSFDTTNAEIKIDGQTVLFEKLVTLMPIENGKGLHTAR